MSGLFASFDPSARGAAIRDIRIDAATRADVPAIARLVSERDGVPFDGATTSIQGELERLEAGATTKRLFVARLADRSAAEPAERTERGRHTPCAVRRQETRDGIVGFGRCQHLPTDEIPGARNMPAGWYLAGMIVAPAVRRRGIGRALCVHRLAWMRRFTGVAYYYASARNLASIRLHETLGFRELTRDFAFPDLVFTGGVGILFRAEIGGSAPPSAAARSRSP